MQRRPPGYGQTVQFLASGATPGLLEPGEDIKIPIYYAGWLQGQWDFTRPPINFTVGAIETTDTTPFDWSALQAASQPSDITPTAWGAVFANLQTETGATYGVYVQRLDDESSYLNTLGENVVDIGQLIGFEIQQADGLSPITQLGASVDAAVATPGDLSLSFGRFFSPNITGRSQMGPLGLGWSDSWQTAIAVQSDGSVIVTGPGGSERAFQNIGNGAYTDGPGDYGVLSQASDGVYSLVEQDGQVTAFNADGTLSYVQDASGNTINAGYTGGLLTSLTASSGQSLAIAYNTANLIDRVTDSDGRATVYTYDSSNTHLMSVTTFDGATTSYTYSSGGTAPTNDALTSIASPAGTHSYYTYDAEGRFASASADGGAEMTTFAYGPGGAVTSTDALGDSTTIDFDSRGLVVKVKDPLGRISQFTYDASYHLTQSVDPDGQVTLNQYDSAGHLLSTTDPLGHTTKFIYTDNNLASVTDAKGNATNYAYNGQRNLASTTYADGTIASLAYDPVGNLLSSTDQMGQVLTYTYNAAGQVLTKTYADGTVDTFTYDAQGKLTSTVDPTGTTALTYDAADRLIEILYPSALYLKYTYDAAGRRTQMVDQDGFTVNYTYDAAGRLSQLTDASGNLVDKYTYDAAGNLVREDKGNGTYTTYTYDAAGELLDLVNYAQSGSVNSRFDYTYNALAQRTTEATVDGTWTYTYDADGELTHAVFASTNSAVASQDLTYNYDAVGNRTSTVSNGVNTVYTTDSMNRYTAVGNLIESYNADGDLTSQQSASGTWLSSYNGANQLVSETAPDGATTAFSYDALGDRVGETSGGVAEALLVDPFDIGETVGEFNQSLGTSSHFTYGLGLVEPGRAGLQPLLRLPDALGSTAGLTGQGGSYVDQYSYDPFGTSLTRTETAANPFQFNGQFGVTSRPRQFPVHARSIRLDRHGSLRYDGSDRLDHSWRQSLRVRR